MKRLSTFLLALLLTWIGASAQSSWTAPGSTLTSGGSYYLYNTEAEQYMGKVTLQWGTEAGFSSTGLVVTLESSNSAYNIKTTSGYVFFNGTYLYVDGSTVANADPFTFTAMNDGTYTIQTASDGYLGYEGNGSIEIKTTLTSSDSGIYWELVDENTGMDLHNALVILYNTLVHAESYGMTNSNTAYAEAGEVYLSSTATEDEVMAAVAALEEAMEEYATVADPDDVTYAFITNPNFDTGSLTGWTQSGSSGFAYHSDPHTNGEITIDGYAESWTWWENNATLGNQTFGQTLSELPAGIYRLEVDAIATQQNDASVTVTGVNLYAGSNKTPMHSASGLPEHFTVNFEVADASGTVDIGVEVASTTANWVAVDNFRLYYLGEEYKAGDEVHGCEAEFGHWTITDHTTGLFQHNTWSTENDASGMVTPFIEYWIGSGKELEDATISHYTITGEPGEIYAVSIDYRAFNENSDKKVSQGSTFTANGTSFDLCVGTRSVFDNVSQEEYAIGYTILCKADETTGAIDVKFDIKDADFDWLAFKDLSIALFDGTSWPTLTAATGDMHTGYADAQSTALAVYNGTKSFENYLAAFNAVNAAQLSALFYSDIAETLTELNLDEAGKAAFSATANGAAYEAKTLDYCDMTGTYITAEASQTVGTKLVYAVNNTKWICEQGNGPTKMDNGYETYVGGSNFTAGKVMYQKLENLPEGYTYEVTFHCFSQKVNDGTGNSGSNIAVAYANNQTKEMTVVTTNINNLDDESNKHTFTVTIGADGSLEYGINNVAAGGNWCMADLKSITITAVGISWEMTEAEWGTLILPFEADVPSGLTAYTIGSVTTEDDDDDIAATLSLTASDAIAANTPYIMGGTENTYTFTGTPTNTQNSYSSDAVNGASLTGTLVDMSLAKGDFTTDGNQYVLQNHVGEGGLAFYPITTASESTGVTLDAYHCYLTYSNTSGVKGFISFAGTDDEATGIVAVEGAEAEGNGAIYDLSGRKVSKAVKGVYIQNGKKVLVK